MSSKDNDGGLAAYTSENNPFTRRAREMKESVNADPECAGTPAPTAAEERDLALYRRYEAASTDDQRLILAWAIARYGRDHVVACYIDDPVEFLMDWDLAMREEDPSYDLGDALAEDAALPNDPDAEDSGIDPDKPIGPQIFPQAPSSQEVEREGSCLAPIYRQAFTHARGDPEIVASEQGPFEGLNGETLTDISLEVALHGHPLRVFALGDGEGDSVSHRRCTALHITIKGKHEARDMVRALRFLADGIENGPEHKKWNATIAAREKKRV